MKGYPAAAVAASAAKQRRWKWLALAILLLVFFSMLVPLAFLLGLHNGFPVGYSSDESPPSVSFQNYGHAGGANEQNSSEGASRVEQMLRNFAPSLPLDIGRSTFGEGGGLSKNSEVQDSKQPNRSMDAPSLSKSEGMTPLMVNIFYCYFLFLPCLGYSYPMLYKCLLITNFTFKKIT
ncbi:putative galacturonosyltransferase 7 [Apostasia shenzhenica]|uniref:Putative galacturonosyltransferase 7 n=1 Tax=Apostasia shenzhenica TaxID=1088818 RepID=A0A2I0A8H8_9ASPA|nr:putative galacturonosyltransferase 7 [Apostasia shenzhenica]